MWRSIGKESRAGTLGKESRWVCVFGFLKPKLCMTAQEKEVLTSLKVNYKDFNVTAYLLV